MIKSLHFTEDFVTIEYDNGQKLIEPLATFISTVDAAAISNSIITDSIIVLEDETPVNATKATITTDISVVNGDLVFTAVTAGAAGNNIKVEYINTWVEDGEGKGEDGIDIPVELSVSVADNTVTVKLGTDDEGVITSKANDIKDLINGTEDMIITADNKQNDNGDIEVVEMTAISLATGVDGTVAVKGQVYADDTYLYVAKDDNSVSDNNWRRISLGSVY